MGLKGVYTNFLYFSSEELIEDFSDRDAKV